MRARFPEVVALAVLVALLAALWSEPQQTPDLPRLPNEVSLAQVDAPDQPAVTCECQDPADQDLADLEEEALPPLNQRPKKVGQSIPLPDTDDSHKVFFGNLHSHTSFSDGRGLPGEAYLHARNAGELDFLALTEHNHTGAGGSAGIAQDHDKYNGANMDALIPVANGMTTDGVFVAIYGQEFSSISKGNHLCVFDVPNVIDEDDVENGDFKSLLNTWLPANIDSGGTQGLLQLNHPWSSSCPNAIEYGRDDFSSFDQWRTKLDAQAQLIEVINGPSHENATGVKPATINASEFRRYLKMGFHLAPTANQDNHFKTWGTITDARTGVIATALTKAEILSGLRKRHVYASLDKNLRVVATIQDKLIGSVISTPISTGDELSIDITLRDADAPSEIYWVEVFADNVSGASANSNVQLVATYGPLNASAGGEGAWSLPGLEYADWDYLYMKVLRGPEAAPEKLAYLAPVWFED